MRLAMIYALLDCAPTIAPAHLRAALAVWEYAEASATYVFGSSLGDEVADRILRELVKAGPQGMSRSDIGNIFDRNKLAEEIDQALQVLATGRRARRERVHTGGRPKEMWYVA